MVGFSLCGGGGVQIWQGDEFIKDLQFHDHRESIMSSLKQWLFVRDTTDVSRRGVLPADKTSITTETFHQH